MFAFALEVSVSSAFLWPVKATFLLAVAWGLHASLRTVNPRWQVCLWRTTLVALVGLPLLGLVIPRWHIAVPANQQVVFDDPLIDGVAEAETMKFPSYGIAGENGMSSLELTTMESSASAQVIRLPMAESTVRETAVANAGTVNGKLVAVSIWFVVAGTLLLRLLLSFLRVRSLIRNSVPAEPDLIELASQAMKETGLRRLPEIRTSRSVAIPFVTGALRPVVVLPVAAEHTAEASELKLILTHELGHVAGRDVLWAMLAYIVRSLLWFHPLAWRMPSAHQMACETVCDALATQNDSARATYQSLLAKLALLVNDHHVVRGNVAMSATAEITRRLRRLEDHISSQSLSPSRRLLVMTASLVFVSTIATATLVPRRAAAETPAAKQSDSDTAIAQDEADNSNDKWTVRLSAIDTDTRIPIAGAEFTVQIGEDSTPYQANNEGSCSVMIPSRNPRYCYFKVRAEGYTPMRGFWANHTNRTDKLPEEVTFRMTRGITVGGTVVDEENEPIAGATVWFSAGNQVTEERLEQSFHEEEYITDEQGRWRCPIAPQEMNSATFKVNHPDYARITTGFGIDRQIDELRTQTHSWTLKNGFVIRGVVTGPDGLPVEDAHLAVGTSKSYDDDGPFAVTDADGRYEFRRVRPSSKGNNSQRPFQMSVTVLPKGLAPQMAVVPGTGDVALEPSTWNERSMDFQLDEGHPLRVRVTDNQDKPVKKVRIFPSEWRDGTDGLRVLRKHGIPEHTNEEGIWLWDSAPSGQKLKYDIVSRGYMSVRKKTLVAGDDAKIRIAASRPHILTGHVIDADTNQPIDEFVIQQGFEGMSQREHPDGVWWTNNTRARDGRYRRVLSRSKPCYRWKFVAKGYQPFASDSIPVGEGEFILNVELKKISRRNDKPAQKEKAAVLKQISGSAASRPTNSIQTISS